MLPKQKWCCTGFVILIREFDSLREIENITLRRWRRGLTRWSAKPLFVGSNPTLCFFKMDGRLVMTSKDFSNMGNRELLRIRFKDLTRPQLDSYFREVSERRRRIKSQLSEFDDVMRLINVELSKV